MTIVPRFCDECGREMSKAHRNQNGHRYCSTCYARVFKPKECPLCGEIYRLPTTDPDAVCRRCKNDKPCIRCGRDQFKIKIGKITPYGPVCNSCSPYFREPKLCERCGKASTRLTRVKRLNIDQRVCPRCARADHGTCSACSRHRRLFLSPTGEMLCKKCLEVGETQCSECRKQMPAGYGPRCQSCYWKDLLTKRLKMDSVIFTSSSFAAHFERFGMWLLTKVGEQKAAITIHKYLRFFTDMDRQWADIPDYKELLNHFGTARLRRYLLPMQWLQEFGYVIPVDSIKVQDSESRRINASLNAFSADSKEFTIIDSYHKKLRATQINRKSTLRSIRLALTPAVKLLQLARASGKMPPNQHSLNGYLASSPGQRAAISGFVNHLRTHCDTKVVLPSINSSQLRQQRRKKLERELIGMMTKGQSNDYEQQWIALALAYFHKLPRHAGTQAYVCYENDGMIARWDNQRYWIPFLTRPEELDQDYAKQGRYKGGGIDQSK